MTPVPGRERFVSISAYQMGLIVMMVGVVSIALSEPLARLDDLVVDGGPYLLEQERRRFSRRMIVGVGVSLLLLAALLIVAV